MNKYDYYGYSFIETTGKMYFALPKNTPASDDPFALVNRVSLNSVVDLNHEAVKQTLSFIFYKSPAIADKLNQDPHVTIFYRDFSQYWIKKLYQRLGTFKDPHGYKDHRDWLRVRNLLMILGNRSTIIIPGNAELHFEQTTNEVTVSDPFGVLNGITKLKTPTIHQ